MRLYDLFQWLLVGLLVIRRGPAAASQCRRLGRGPVAARLAVRTGGLPGRLVRADAAAAVGVAAVGWRRPPAARLILDTTEPDEDMRRIMVVLKGDGLIAAGDHAVHTDCPAQQLPIERRLMPCRRV